MGMIKNGVLPRSDNDKLEVAKLGLCKHFEHKMLSGWQGHQSLGPANIVHTLPVLTSTV